MCRITLPRPCRHIISLAFFGRFVDIRIQLGASTSRASLTFLCRVWWIKRLAALPEHMQVQWRKSCKTLTHQPSKNDHSLQLSRSWTYFQLVNLDGKGITRCACLLSTRYIANSSNPRERTSVALWSSGTAQRAVLYCIYTTTSDNIIIKLLLL